MDHIGPYFLPGKSAVATPQDKGHTNHMAANSKQVGGAHYKGSAIEHWDIVAQHNLDYFQGQITKYVMRWRKKNGIQDLEKAQHFLEKYIELAKADSAAEPDRNYVDQDRGGAPIPWPTVDRSPRE